MGISEGDIVDTAGNKLGTHEGTPGFTIGQRKGLHIGTPAPDGLPRFVLEIRPKTNTVVVGPKEALDIIEIAGTSFTWCGEPQENPENEFDVEVQIRAHADPVPAVAQLVGDELIVRPANPLNSVAAGQTAVIYVGTRVLGQFTIARTVSDLNVVATA